MNDGKITMPDGRTVSFADYGTSDQIPVLWCHGGPGCRFEPGYVAADAARAGLRLVGMAGTHHRRFGSRWPRRRHGHFTIVPEVMGAVRQMLNGKLS